MADVAGYAVSTDFPSFQAALDSKPGILYVPPGTHSVGTGVTLNRSKKIIGAQGGGQTILSSSGPFVLRIADGVNFCTIQHIQGQPASQGYVLEIGSSQGHHVYNLFVAGSGNNRGLIKATGLVKRSTFRTASGFFIDSVVYIDFGNHDHECLIFENIFGDELADNAPSPYQFRGNCIWKVCGAMDNSPRDAWHHEFKSPSRGCGIITDDLERGNGAYVKALGADTSVCLVGCLLNTGSTSSLAPPILRAEGGAKIVAIGLSRVGNSNYSTFASTDSGLGSSIVLLEPAEDPVGGLAKGNSGNVKLLRDGAWS